MKLKSFSREHISRFLITITSVIAIGGPATAQMAAREVPSGPGASVYMDITVEEKDPISSFTSIELGPCQWSVDGRQFDNSLLKINNLFVTNLGAQAPEEGGYKFALKCKDHIDGVFDVQLGFGKNLTPAQIMDSNEIFEGTINDTTVFLSFRVKIGNRR